MLPQALEFIFEVKKKKSNEQMKRRKISFSIYNFSFLLLNPFFFQIL